MLFDARVLNKVFMMEREQTLHLLFSNGYYYSITITRLGLIIGGRDFVVTV